jgi:hypothetical protein
MRRRKFQTDLRFARTYRAQKRYMALVFFLGLFMLQLNQAAAGEP